MTEEGFIKDKSPDWLSFLKLRASWDLWEMKELVIYPYQAVINFSNAYFIKWTSGIRINSGPMAICHRNISWEKRIF